MPKKSQMKKVGRRSSKPFRFGKGTIARWLSRKQPVLLGGPSRAASVEAAPPKVQSEAALRESERAAYRARHYDEEGYLKPFTEAEGEGVRQMIEEFKSIHNGPEEDDREFMRAMDADRPDFPLFRRHVLKWPAMSYSMPASSAWLVWTLHFPTSSRAWGGSPN